MTYSTSKRIPVARVSPCVVDDEQVEMTEHELFCAVNARSIHSYQLKHMRIPQETRDFFASVPLGLERFRLYLIACIRVDAQKKGISNKIDFEYWRNNVNIYVTHKHILYNEGR
jgi:hypothetical protein